jgi:RNA polymerase sigma-70 factor, ECF subfamily
LEGFMAEHDQTTLECAVAGDSKALSKLLCKHGPVVQTRLRIASPWRSMLEPEDVMQITYVEAFLQIGRFDPRRGTSFENWLSQIAQNNLRDAIRGLSRQKQPQPRNRVQLPANADSYSGLLEALCTMSATPSRDAGKAEARALIEQALQRLPPDYSRVVRLYDLEGQPVAEVAATMKRTPGAVFMLRARALDRLAEALGTESMFFSTPP